MDLFYRKEGQGDPLIILHGLFGSSDNWMTLAKRYGKHFEVIIPDLRNHGQSPHSDEFNYEVMSEDIYSLIKKLNLRNINIIGHSMGGKVAMKFCSLYGDMVNKLVVADISPKQYPVHHHEIIASMKSLSLQDMKSRSEADKTLSLKISDFGQRQFLLKNLKRETKGFEWKMALDIIAENISEVGKALTPDELINNETLFIRGSNSWYIPDDDFDLIHHHFKNVRISTLNGAGHWLHAEKPEAFFTESTSFLLK